MKTPKTDGEAWIQYMSYVDADARMEVVGASFAREMEKLLQQVLPDYADEVVEEDRHKVVAEITGNDVIMIRDFLKSK